MSGTSFSLPARRAGIYPARGRRILRALLCVLVLVQGFSLKADVIYHVLQRGETLFSLSRQYNVPVEAIMSANGISDPSKLQAGQKLVIPGMHKVQKGETLFSIARSYGISVQSLRSANKLGPSSIIKVGDLLVVPGGSAPATTASSQSAAGASQSAVGASQSAVGASQSAVGASQTGGGPSPAAGGASQSAAATEASRGTSGAPAAFDPPAVKVSDRSVDMKLSWPCAGEASYLDGKLFGVLFRPKEGAVETAVASGTVVSAGPYRGFGQVVFVQGRGGLIYVYGGNQSLGVRVGDKIRSGQELGLVGVDAKEGRPSPVAYFFVFKNGEALDPASAPRD
ncbi:MAG TPA: LysM peptidoglycan-binding domain-containing protein [Rectinemataceae bacterium]|nr:LysM peptidoglycan-binding domain-containing protein [Rectinemataceae bacterium]